MSPCTDEGAKAAAEDDKEQRVCLPVEKEKEGISAEPGGSAEGSPAGERTTPQREPGVAGEAGSEGSEWCRENYAFTMSE